MQYLHKHNGASMVSEFEEVTPQDAGLYQDLVCFLSNEAKLKQHIEDLVSQSIIHKERLTGGL
jgi:hypothetical protein